jgi:hypothetical protein
MRLLAVLVAVPAMVLSCWCWLGCDPGAGEDDALPDGFQNALISSDLIKLTVPGSEAEAATQPLKGDQPSTKAFWYLETIDSVRQLNGFTWALMHWVEEVTSRPYTTRTENTLIWGPYTPALSLVTMKFILERFPEDGTFHYELQFAPKGASSAEFEPVLEGDFEPEAGVTHSEGMISLNYDKAGELDETIKAVGRIIVFYDTTGGKRYINIQLDEFKDKHMDDPATGTYDYKEEEDLSGTFTFDFDSNIHKDLSEYAALTQEERVNIVTKWAPSGRGRADVEVSDGDLDQSDPPCEKWLSSECWNDLFDRVYFDTVAILTGGAEVTVQETGDPTQCISK